MLCLLDSDGENLRAEACVVSGRPDLTAPPDSLGLEGSMIRAVLRSGQPVRATVDGEALIATSPPGFQALMRVVPIGQLLIVPLVVGDRPVGVLLATRTPDDAPFGPHDEALAIDLARRVAVPAEHSRLLASAARHADQQAALARIGERALADLPIDELLAFVVSELHLTLEADTAGLLEAADDGRSAFMRIAHGLPQGVTIPLSVEGRARLAAHDTAVLALHIDGPDYADTPGPALGLATSMSVLLLPEGGPPSFLGVGRFARRMFKTADRRFLASVAHLLAAAIALRGTHERLRRQALTDSLTGLPNRAMLADRLRDAAAEADATGTSMALLLADLDGFKIVNDSMGHSDGDLLLRVVAARLAAVTRPHDLVARLGGDEFALLCTGVDERGAVAIARRALAALAEPIVLGRSPVQARASFGVAVYTPGDSAGTGTGGVDDLLPHADLAMYRAKAAGGHGVAVYDVALHEQAQRRLAVEQGLRRAVRTGEGLRLVYQPVVDLRSGEVRGVEALVRWDEPALGPLTPAEFIPVAEDSRLVCELDAWVVAEAARCAVGWDRAGVLRDRRVGVNLSARNFSDPDFVPRIERVLRAAGCAPRHLLVEVTEAVLAEGPGPAGVQALLDLGVEVAVDDYGTGRSSLAQLKRIPVRYLKIDRSLVAGLVTDPGDATVVASALTLGHALGKVVIAEGIETADQLRALVANGCTEGQGHLLGRPSDGAVAARWLADGLDVPVAVLLAQSPE